MQDSWKRVCRKAHLYLKISHDKTPSALPRRYSICGKRSETEYTQKFKHLNLNRKEIQEIHHNTLRNFLLRGFNKHLSWFRCGAKGKHLNLEAMLNPTLNPLTTNALQDFQQPCPRFRSQAGVECHRLQMCPGGASGWGIHQTRSRTTQASEPELNPRNSLQHIETLSIVRLHQASPLVQMQWKRGASEPYHKTESGSQPTHSKRVARISATTPVVQIPTGFGTPQNTNTPRGHF